MKDAWIGWLVALAGAFSLFAALQDWEWFFTSLRTRLFVKMFGRKGARVFYGLLGAVLLGVGVTFALGLLGPGEAPR